MNFWDFSSCVNPQCGPEVLGLICLKIEDTRGRNVPFSKNQNKLHWHIYRLLRGRTVSEKLPEILLFRPSLIHQLRLLRSQQHPQSGELLTTFSTWATENSLAEINLEGTWGDKGLLNFWGQKLTDACYFVGGRIIVQKKKSRDQNAAGRTR